MPVSWLPVLLRKHLMLLFSGLVCLASLSLQGCGYQPLTFSLPDGDRRIAVLPVQNLTYTPGLSLWLHTQLQKDLSQVAGLRVVSSAPEADWVLSVTLSSATMISGSHASETSTRTFTHTLSGTWVLQKQGASSRQRGPFLVTGSAQHIQLGNALQTPALENHGWQKMVTQFSQNLAAAVATCANCKPEPAALQHTSQ